MPIDEPLELPRTFGDYTLLRRLAVGGMAEVYVAKARGIAGFEKQVAIKVIHPRYSEDDHFVNMLVEEAKISVLLNHANIAQTFHLGCIDGTYYIVMEFIEGADAYRVMRKVSEMKRALPIDICAFICAEVCNGLHYAHRKRDAEGRPLGIVHRDISPQNVLISYAGEVKIVDFGIAKAALRSTQTEAGVIKGKYYYMSPEQAWGDPMDHRSDIFSTGVVLYELVTGRMMYTEDNIQALLDKVRKAEIPPPETRRPSIPKALSQIVMKALARDPGQRFQSAQEMAEALTGFLYATSPTFTAARLADLMGTLFPEEVQRHSAIIALPPAEHPLAVPDTSEREEEREPDSSASQPSFDLADEDDQEGTRKDLFPFRRTEQAASAKRGPQSAERVTKSAVSVGGGEPDRALRPTFRPPRIEAQPVTLDDTTAKQRLPTDEIAREAKSDPITAPELPRDHSGGSLAQGIPPSFADVTTNPRRTPAEPTTENMQAAPEWDDVTHLKDGEEEGDPTLVDTDRDGLAKAIDPLRFDSVKPRNERGKVNVTWLAPERVEARSGHDGPPNPRAQVAPVTSGVMPSGEGHSDLGAQAGGPRRPAGAAMPRPNIEPGAYSNHASRPRVPPGAPVGPGISWPAQEARMPALAQVPAPAQASNLAASHSFSHPSPVSSGAAPATGPTVDAGRPVDPAFPAASAPAWPAVPSGPPPPGPGTASSSPIWAAAREAPNGAVSPALGAPDPTARPQGANAGASITGGFEALESQGPVTWVGMIAIAIGIPLLIGLAIAFAFGRHSAPPAFEIISSPSGAQVSIDGRRLGGLTPLTITEGLEPGRTYLIEVSVPGYQPASQSLTAQAGLQRHLFVLTPLPATLRVETDPPGLEVLVNGAPRGASPIEVTGLSAGQEVEVRTQLPGRGVVVRRIRLGGGTTVERIAGP